MRDYDFTAGSRTMFTRHLPLSAALFERDVSDENTCKAGPIDQASGHIRQADKNVISASSVGISGEACQCPRERNPRRKSPNKVCHHNSAHDPLSCCSSRGCSEEATIRYVSHDNTTRSLARDIGTSLKSADCCCRVPSVIQMKRDCVIS